jgi:15-cis-phytoene synthase
MTAVEQAYEDCRRVVQASGSSFRAGMRLLPADRRPAIYAVYALARRIDDIADGDLPAEAKLSRFERLRAELASPDPPENSLLVAVRDAAQRFPIPVGAFGDLLDGVESDVRGHRYETFAELERYCRCVAGSIGRLCLGVFETSDRERAEPLADDLGVALQLGNILRDLREDLGNGRAYLPQEDVDRFGGDLTLVVAFEAERALGWLEHGMTLVPLLDRSSARCVLAMTSAYRKLIERIAADPELPLQRRVSLSSWQKRVIVARSVVGAS